MKKITLSLDEQLLAGARKVATERGTTLEALISEQLEQLVREKPRKEAARQGLLDLMSKSKARLGPDYIWNRNEIYRRFGGPSHADD